MDQQIKQAGFNQNGLDQIARQGFANAQFEMDIEEGVNVMEEFYANENSEVEQVQPESRAKTKPKFNQDDGFVQDIQQGLQGSVRSVN